MRKTTTRRRKTRKTTTSKRARLPAPAPLLFLGLSPAECPLSRARVAFIPAPFDQTTSYMPGTRFGPRAILEASRQVEFYDEELDLEPFRIGIATLAEIEVVPGNPAAELDRLEAVCAGLANAGILPFTLGGEHSLTIAPVRALKARYPDLCVLQLDAHLDLRAEYQGTRLSHASVMRRVRELGVPTVAVGIRSVSREEADMVHAEAAPVFLAREIREKGLPVDAILSRLGTPVYVTIDLDAFDPAYVPGVGTPEPGGLTWEEGLKLLRAVCERRQVVGCDIVELCPIPGQPVSDFFAAKLANKMIGYLGLSQAEAARKRPPPAGAPRASRRSRGSSRASHRSSHR
ncbi:MAG TPA: agmatinase [Candidatus Eisenbacteria bacterium]|nr:agmatinase [Candidatus Eisenbacteria bacterium]